MIDARGTGERISGRDHRGANASTARDPAQALAAVASDSPTVLLLGLEDVHEDAWAVLDNAGVELSRVTDLTDALDALARGDVWVVISGPRWARSLIDAVRSRRELASVHVVVAAELESPTELREALDAGADDVMRVPFEPEVLAARVAAGLRAARLRANEALLRSLVASIPGAVYRGAWDPAWPMDWISDGVERITGYPAADFIHCAKRTFASVIHPDDREKVERAVSEAASAGRPYTMEYRIQRRDGEVRWVLERGQVQESTDGRRWLDGVIFDITVRRAAERALREREIVEAQLSEVRASRARIVEAADRARREIERNLHDGAQQRLVSVSLDLQRLADRAGLPNGVRGDVKDALAELRTGLTELRDLARGLHPSVLTDRGLEQALKSLAHRAAVPVELRVTLRETRLVASVEAAAYYTVSEALTNVSRYADATRAWVDVEQLDSHVEVEVGDDGAGGVDLEAGSGLQGLCDRVAAVNGSLTIESPPGAGTILRARLPID
jgi:PAS domain S-box-containing protein